MRYYSSTAGAMTLAADAGAGDTTLQVSTVVGLPASFPYTLILDPGGAEEIVTVTAGSGTTLTVARASDGTSAQSHSLGDPVRHGISARDLREPQEHIAATADVHGVVGDLVGATEVQDLTNKTLKAASAATPGAIVKGAASQTAAILDVQDSAGSSLVSVLPGEGTHTVGSTVKTNNGPTANVFKYIKRIIIGAADVVGLQVRANAAQTADLQQWQKSDGTTLAKVDKDGGLTAASISTPGALTAAAASVSSLSSSGVVSGTNGTFSGTVSTPTGDVVVGDVTSTAGRSLYLRKKTATSGDAFEALETIGGSGTSGTLAMVLKKNGAESSRLELAEDGSADLGTPGARFKVGVVSSAKAGKRSHWVTATVTTDSSGYATVTHGAGFTPATVMVSGGNPAAQNNVLGADNYTSTTFRLRAVSGGGASVATTVVVNAFLGE